MTISLCTVVFEEPLFGRIDCGEEKAGKISIRQNTGGKFDHIENVVIQFNPGYAISFINAIVAKHPWLLIAFDYFKRPGRVSDAKYIETLVLLAYARHAGRQSLLEFIVFLTVGSYQYVVAFKRYLQMI
jgi:hypothetical protein